MDQTGPGFGAKVLEKTNLYITMQSTGLDGSDWSWVRSQGSREKWGNV